jgi:hypothetical protein
MKKIVFIIILLLFCAVNLNQLHAVKKKNTNKLSSKSYDLGASIGMWLGGDIWLDDLNMEISKESSLLVHLFYDSYLMQKFSLGAYLNYSPATLSYGSIEEDATMLELGGAIKYKILFEDKYALKIGLGLGYRKLSVEGLSEADGEGFGLNLSVEGQYCLQNGHSVFVETGFLTQPAGGNDDTSITWSPIFYLSAGYAL